MEVSLADLGDSFWKRCIFMLEKSELWGPAAFKESFSILYLAGIHWEAKDAVNPGSV